MIENEKNTENEEREGGGNKDRKTGRKTEVKSYTKGFFLLLKILSSDAIRVHFWHRASLLLQSEGQRLEWEHDAGSSAGSVQQRLLPEHRAAGPRADLLLRLWDPVRDRAQRHALVAGRTWQVFHEQSGLLLLRPGLLPLPRWRGPRLGHLAGAADVRGYDMQRVMWRGVMWCVVCLSKPSSKLRRRWGMLCDVV